MFANLIVLVCVLVALYGARADMSADLERSTIDAGDSSKYVADPTIIYSNSTLEESNGWVSYKQCDSRWANNRLGTCSQTICSAGCAMSSVAMMLKTKGANVDPASFNSHLTNNGGYASGCNIIWAKADSYGKTTFQAIETASESAICSGLSKGHGIIANVNNGGHWVLLTSCAGNGVFNVNDPGYSRTTYKMSEIVREAVYH